MIQLQQAKNSFQRLKKDISDVSDTLFVEWCQYIVNYLYDQIVGTTDDRLRKSYSFSFSSGASTITLPTDFDAINVGGTGVFLTDTSGNVVSALTKTSFGSTEYGYYLDGNSLVITGAPYTSQAAILRYVGDAPVFSALTEYFSSDKTLTGTPIFKDADLEGIVRALDVQYCIWDEDISMEALADQRFVRALSQILSRARRTVETYNLNCNISSL